MINVEKYIDNPVTEEDLSKVFTPQIVDKANEIFILLIAQLFSLNLTLVSFYIHLMLTKRTHLFQFFYIILSQPTSDSNEND